LDAEGSVACGVAHQVYALDAASGGKLWEFATAGVVLSTPAVVGGKFSVGSTGDTKVRVVDCCRDGKRSQLRKFYVRPHTTLS